MGKILVVLRILIFGIFISTGMATGEYPVEKPSLNSGREIFNSNCAGCHGEKGEGLAFKGAFNFSNNELMISKNSSAFFDAVTNGIPGTAMPSFGKLPVQQRWDVVAYLWTFWMDSAVVEGGKIIYQKNCSSCHGINGDGSGIIGAFDFTNITRMVQEDPELFFNRVSDGVNGTSMPSWRDSLSEDERWMAVKYVWTFQFKDYFRINQPTSKTSGPEKTSSGNTWYSSLSGMVVIAISILLAIVVLYLFGKGMQER